MTILVGVMVILIGLALLILGLGFFTVFKFAERHFDHALKAELATQGRDQVERAAMKIQNPFVRRVVLKHFVQTGGTVAVSVVRGALESRKRTGFYMAIAGAVALTAGVLHLAMAAVDLVGRIRRMKLPCPMKDPPGKGS